MKDRQKKMLRLLLTQEGVIQIDDLAHSFSIGRRTVTRDLDIIEHWLALKGIILERKPNQGIRVLSFSNELETLLGILNRPSSYIESLSPLVRQKMLLLYIIFNNREIKISEMANAFFLSDTSIWNDLNHMEKDLDFSSVLLERQKGIGIHLKGNEKEIRLLFLRTLTDLFSSKTIIPYLYNFREDKKDSLEVNQFRTFMHKIGFPENNGKVIELLNTTAEKIGYELTMSGEALVCFYMQLTIHRVKSGALIEQHDRPDIPDSLIAISKELLVKLTARFFSGNLPRGEAELLSLIVMSLENSDYNRDRQLHEVDYLSDETGKFTEALINEFDSIDHDMFYLDEVLYEKFKTAVRAMILRLRHGIPLWHGDWGHTDITHGNFEQKKKITEELLRRHFALSPDYRDLEYLLMYHHSLVLQHRAVPDRKLRCLVCCFEGIGLASYLQTILKREIPELDIVESTAVNKINENYIKAGNINLLLSTFPVNNLSIPVINIQLPLNKDVVKKEIKKLLSQMDPSEEKQNNTSVQNDTHSDLLPFDTIWEFIHTFSFADYRKLESIDEVISKLSADLIPQPDKADMLAEDFRRRENLGKLEFEDERIRVLHCKSKAVSEPHSGIIEHSSADYDRILFLLAPDPCPENIRKMLSAITVSILDNAEFSHAVRKGTLRDIHKNLMNIYKDFI